MCTACVVGSHVCTRTDPVAAAGEACSKYLITRLLRGPVWRNAVAEAAAAVAADYRLPLLSQSSAAALRKDRE